MQRVGAVPTPFRVADPLRPEPAFPDGDSPRAREKVAGAMAVSPVVVARGKRGQVVHQLRRVFQIRRLKFADLRDEETVGSVRELWNQSSRLTGRCELGATALERNPARPAKVRSIPSLLSFTRHLGLGLYRNRGFSAMIVARRR